MTDYMHFFFKSSNFINLLFLYANIYPGLYLIKDFWGVLDLMNLCRCRDFLDIVWKVGKYIVNTYPFYKIVVSQKFHVKSNASKLFQRYLNAHMYFEFSYAIKRVWISRQDESILAPWSPKTVLGLNADPLVVINDPYQSPRNLAIMKNKTEKTFS